MSIETPSADEYAALTAGCGLFDDSERGKLTVSGPGAADFLDSLLSNDIAAIALGAGAEATLLTHKGRMLAALRVLRTAEDRYWLDTERAGLQALFDALHNYRIGYEAQLHKRTLERGLLSLVGPGAPYELVGDELHANAWSQLAGHDVLATRTPLGVDVFCDAPAVADVAAALSVAVPVTRTAYDCVRIEHGLPRFGIELDDSTMPQEAGMHERAVSYTKGCYVGQETVARLYWKGKPNRHLRGIRLEQPVEAGATLLLAGAEVGNLASATVSPRLGPIGLAMVRREAQPGATLQVEQATATVVELPFQ